MIFVDVGQRLHPATADPGLRRRDTQEKRSFFFWDVLLHKDGYALIVGELLLVGYAWVSCDARRPALLRIAFPVTVRRPFGVRTTSSGLVMEHYLQVVGVALTLATYEPTLAASWLQSIALRRVRRIGSSREVVSYANLVLPTSVAHIALLASHCSVSS